MLRSFKSKKGATPMAIFVLVLFTIAISSYSLYMFNLNNNKIQLEISDSNSMNVLIAEKQSFEFFAERLIEQVFLDSYSEEDNENFEEDFLSELKERINSMYSQKQDEDVFRFKNLIDWGKYELSFNNEEKELAFVFPEVVFINPVSNMGMHIIYRPKIEFSFVVE